MGTPASGQVYIGLYVHQLMDECVTLYCAMLSWRCRLDMLEYTSVILEYTNDMLEYTSDMLSDELE